MSYKSVSPSEAAALIDERAVVILDVRTPQEYEDLGHIPGAWLLPLDLIASAPAVLPDDGRAVLVYCEHGVRSVTAAQWLAAAGVRNVINMSGGMSRWTGAREHEPGRVRGPSGWLLATADLLPRGGRVLDVAAGRGRHALLLAGAGFSVHAVDADASALAALVSVAQAAGLDVSTETLDLEAKPLAHVGSAAAYDAVLVFNYLHRPLMPAIAASVAPGGVLIYETFLAGQAERGHPTNPAYLLQPGELATLVAPLTVLRSREGDVDGRLVSSVAARREA